MMQTLIRLAEFVFNNALLLSVILVAVLFFMFHVKQLFQELLLNKKLDIKQRVVRNLERIPFRYARLFLRKRIVVIMVPFVVVAAVFMAATWNPILFEHHLASISNEEDIMKVHNDFDERFYDFHILEADSEATDAGVMRVLRMQEPTLHKGIDTVAHDDDHIFTIANRGVEIIAVDGSELEHLGYLDYEEMNMDGVYHLHGIFVDDNRLVVMGSVTEDISLGAANEAYCEEEVITVVRVFDIDDGFSLKDTYLMGGKVTDAAFENGTLSLVTKQYLPFGYDKFRPEDYLPWISRNDDTPYRQSYDAMHYIERVEPNSFTSFHAIDLERETHDFRTLLMDYQSEVRITDNAFYIAADHYRFRKITDGMRLSDPVESIDTSLTKFRVEADGTVRHRVTLSLPGALAFPEGLQMSNESVLLLTRKEDTHRLFKFEKNLTHATIEHELPRDIRVDNLFYHDGIAYLSCETDGVNETRLYAITTNSIDLLSVHEGVLLKEMMIPRTGSPLFITMERVDKESFTLQVHHFEEQRNLVATTHTMKLSVADYKFNIIDRFPVDRETYIDSSSRVILPLYAFTTPSTQDSRYPSVLFIPLDEEGRLHSPEALDMRGVLHARKPFSYRYLERDGLVYHITPRGITVTVEDELETEIVGELVFP